MARAHVDVTRREDGTIRIDAAPVAGSAAQDDEPAGSAVHDDEVAGSAGYDDEFAGGPDFTRAVLDVAGAMLTWPVLGVPGPPSAEVHDRGRAQQWLWALYGEHVATAVHDRTAAEPDGVRVAADPTDLAGSAARLALGHWAARWWPASYPNGIPALQPDVLGLELAALTHRCQQLFDGEGDQPDDCTAELIEEHRDALDPLVQWWRAAPQSADTARHLESVLRLIDHAAETIGLDGPALRHLRSSLGQRRPAGVLLDPGSLFARDGGYALAAGEQLVAGGRVIARGSGTNDWRRYPPGFVDAAEDAVSWTARALGARRRIEVEVVAHTAAPPAGAPLVAEVRVNGGRPKRVQLTRTDDRWTGRADLDPGLLGGTEPPRIEVGVLLPGFDPGPFDPSPFDPGSGSDPVPGEDRGRIARDAIRALARRRLNAAAERLTYDTSPYDVSWGPFLAETVAAAGPTGEDY
ncbi:hypothetical protein [Streptomyces doebereineriae]|uniref:Uncharacterized protein n=1 Tax=Streptomyces doebereineriae TaxID=3075528 RepID=A0ABU2V0U9_9ACTN|nr:hypothetical protein [Streptomyces sp. DSM 41640]MDT0479038.1 hypothetical protein [Streptomyces sp. DSM 41640]